MLSTRRLLHRHVWAALIAALALALLPTLVRAASAVSGADLAPVCTAQGLKWVAQASGPTHDAGGSPPWAVPAPDNCPYCSLASAGLLPLGEPYALPSPAAAEGGLCADQAQRLVAHAPWPTAWARAPPG